MADVLDQYGFQSPKDRIRLAANLPASRRPPTPEMDPGMGGRSGELTSSSAPKVDAESALNAIKRAMGGGSSRAGEPARPVFSRTPQQEAQAYHKQYKDDLFGALKGIDSSPLWRSPEGIQHVAAIKQAIIDQASPQQIQQAIRLEQQFQQQNGMTYSQYQAQIYGQRPTHPHGLSDWLSYFEGQQQMISGSR